MRAEAATIFEEAFGDKLRSALPSPELRATALERTLQPEHIVAAIADGRLLGMVGVSAAKGRYQGGVINGGAVFSELRALLGFIGAARAVVGLGLGQYRPGRGELYIDGIAVSASARGRGIGTALLQEAETIARENGFDKVRLDVIDSNLGAQRLYQRLGYQVTEVQHFGVMRHIVGSSGMITMELPLAAGPPQDAEASQAT